MYLAYGSYRHDQWEASYTTSASALENEAGQQYAVRRTWNIHGTLLAATPALLAARYALLQLAYSRWYQNLYFFDDNGTALEALTNAGSLTGVKIIQPPAAPQDGPGEYTTFRNYSIVATADYPTAGAANPLKNFRESLSFSGGGPRRAVVECVNVPPQDQITALWTARRIVQSGSAVGMYAYPPVPGPIFPGFEEVQSDPPGNPQYGSPVLRNGLYVDWPVSWSYAFIAGVSLYGLPNRWPVG